MKQAVDMEQWLEAQQARTRAVAEQRYGRGNGSLMEWAKKQLSFKEGLRSAIFATSLNGYEGLVGGDTDATAMYLDFALAGQDLAEAVREYSAGQN